jgi:hypothetical protein
VTKAEFLERPPESASVTDYDREHMTLYLRLLDAASDGAAWEEAVSILFGINPTAEPERARRVHDSHLARAKWMSQQGYRELAHEHPRE